jgi:hypothetical protein
VVPGQIRANLGARAIDDDDALRALRLCAVTSTNRA